MVAMTIIIIIIIVLVACMGVCVIDLQARVRSLNYALTSASY